MAFSVTSIGVTGYSTSNTAPSTISVGAGGVPLGSIILAITSEALTAVRTATNLSDSGVNSYAIAVNHFYSGANNLDIQWALCNTALVSGNTISFARANGTNWGFSWSASYVTGADTGLPWDSGTLASAQGSSAAPSVTSGAFGLAGELAVGAAGNYNAAATFTQPGSWTQPPNNPPGTAPDNPMTGATQLTVATTALTYNPTMSVSTYWVALIAGLRFFGQAKPAGWVFGYSYIGRQWYSNLPSAQPAYITTPAIPIGSLVCVTVSEATGAGLTSTAVTDSVGNSYTFLGTQAGSSATGGWWYSFTTIAIPSGGQIRYSRQNTSWGYAMQAFYIAGVLPVSPLDTTTHNSQSLTNPTITSTTPVQSGEFFWGSMAGIGSSWTADTTHGFNAGQAQSNNNQGLGSAGCYDAVTQNVGALAVTFAPTQVSAYQQSVGLFSFKMAPILFAYPPPPMKRAYLRR